MMRSAMARLLKPAPALAAASVLVAGGGAYALASAGGGTVTVCVSHKSGTLYKARGCKKHDHKLSWSKQGPQGTPGPQGAPGQQGPPGPTGPGATTFGPTTVAPGQTATLMTLDNGIAVTGTCFAGEVSLAVKTTSGALTLQASGTGDDGNVNYPLDVDQTNSQVVNNGAVSADFYGLARDAAAGGKFAHIDAHGTKVPSSSCDYWGMITPSG
jgi:hypothetical protein